MMALVDFVLSGDTRSAEFGEALDRATDEDIRAVLDLANDKRVEVRRAVAMTVPLLQRGDAPSPAMVAVIIGLTVDFDHRVRDYACFALAEQWREIMDEDVVDALVARVDDIDRDTRSEALLGLAFRRDPRALPLVRAALSRADVVWRLELVAAGALSDPSLHDLVLRHRHGWGDQGAARTADIACRLTDPAGPGEDVVSGVAALYQRRAYGQPDGDALVWWYLMYEMLNTAPHRAGEFLDLVVTCLAGDEDAIVEVQMHSVLAELATSRPIG